MSRINQKLGLKDSARARARMSGRGKDAAAASVTSASCPNCGHRWMLERVRHPGALWCGWCSYGLGADEHLVLEQVA